MKNKITCSIFVTNCSFFFFFGSLFIHHFVGFLKLLLFLSISSKYLLSILYMLDAVVSTFLRLSVLNFLNKSTKSVKSKTL